ncbi:MAG: hypothetical protein CMJ41_01025 [Phycisphaerae bacterium]|nr:hypothetical protein [Phycisphaerae bacterium]
MSDAATTRSMIRSIDDQAIVLAPSSSSYELALVPLAPIEAEPGQRIRGRIEAEALKIHPAVGGGIFIEPLSGQPRIVAGRVIEVDRDERRVLLKSVVPITLHLSRDLDLDQCAEGHFINCHVRSGATFTPEG